MLSKSKKWLDRVRETLRLKHDSRKIEKHRFSGYAVSFPFTATEQMQQGRLGTLTEHRVIHRLSELWVQLKGW